MRNYIITLRFRLHLFWFLRIHKFVELEVDPQGESNDDRGGEILMELAQKPTPYYNYVYTNNLGTAKIYKSTYLCELYLGNAYQERFDYGSGKISFNKSIYYPWYEVEVETMLGSFFSKHNTVMKKGKIVAEATAEEYAP